MYGFFECVIILLYELSNKIYQKNLIHKANENCNKIVNDYTSNLKKLGVSEEHLTKIKEIYRKKKKKYKN